APIALVVGDRVEHGCAGGRRGVGVECPRYDQRVDHRVRRGGGSVRNRFAFAVAREAAHLPTAAQVSGEGRGKSPGAEVDPLTVDPVERVAYLLRFARIAGDEGREGAGNETERRQEAGADI